MEKPYTGHGRELKQMVVEFIKTFIYHSPSSQQSAYSPTVYPPTIHPPVLLPIHLYTIYPSIDLPTYPFSIPDIHQLSVNLLTCPSFLCPSIYHPPSHRPSIHPSVYHPSTHLSIMYPTVLYQSALCSPTTHLSNCLLIRLSSYSPIYHPIHPINASSIHQPPNRSPTHPPLYQPSTNYPFILIPAPTHHPPYLSAF